MKHFSIFLILNLLAIGAISQIRTVEVTREYNEKEDHYDLVANSVYKGRMVVVLEFKDARNIACRDGNNGFTKTIGPGRSLLTRVLRLDPHRPMSFGYTFRYTEGCSNRKPDMNHSYGIPLVNGKATQISEMTYVGDKYGNEEPPKDWYAITLKTTVGDTIVASRRGVVVQVIDDIDKVDSQGQFTFESTRNLVKIQHKDCSMARYELFQKDGVFVKEGQDVEVGTPLGIIGGDQYSSGSHVRFSVFYYDNYEKTNNTNSKRSYAFIPLYLYSNDGASLRANRTKLISVIDQDLITAEMSKRQIKKWLKNQ